MLKEFRSYFWFPWTFNRYKADFLALSEKQQKGLLTCLDNKLPVKKSFELVQQANWQALSRSKPYADLLDKLITDYLTEEQDKQAW